MRITHVITGLDVGGAERALHTLLTGGLQNSHDNQVISLRDDGHYGPLLRKAGVPVICLNMRSGSSSLAALPRLRQAIRLTRPDVIQGWMYDGNLAAHLGRAMANNRPALSWNVRTALDAFAELPLRTRLAVRTCRVLSSGPDSIIFNSSRSRDQHRGFGFAPDRSMVIPNGFDTEIWHPDAESRAIERARLGVPDDAIILGFVGRSGPLKDPRNLFGALKSILPAFTQLHAVIVGRGLAEEAASFELPGNRVIFLGEQNDIPRIMPAFDIFCLCSSGEGFPNVIGEAMACGVPCVTTDVGDAAAIVAETGWVVPPRDSALLAAALKQALSAAPEERKARGLAARRRIERHYSLHSSLDCYLSLYANLSGVK